MNENLIKARDIKTRQDSLDIEKEFVEIYNEILHFERLSLFRDTFSIKIPREYEDMKQERAEIIGIIDPNDEEKYLGLASSNSKATLYAIDENDA